MDSFKPAMTAEGWRVKSFAPEACDSAGVDDEDGLWVYSYCSVPLLDIDDDLACVQYSFRTSTDRHALAALALHDQPFGFTWDDVDLLRREVSMLIGDIDEEEDAHWRSLADRIAALLPPRET